MGNVTVRLRDAPYSDPPAPADKDEWRCSERPAGVPVCRRGLPGLTPAAVRVESRSFTSVKRPGPGAAPTARMSFPVSGPCHPTSRLRLNLGPAPNPGLERSIVPSWSTRWWPGWSRRRGSSWSTGPSGPAAMPRPWRGGSGRRAGSSDWTATRTCWPWPRSATAGLPVTLVHASYSPMREVLDELGIASVQGVLLDLGLSSDQLAWAHRGFSFNCRRAARHAVRPGPSDRPLGRRARRAALSEEELARAFFDYGEERFSRRIARRIVETRRTDADPDHPPARRAGPPERPRRVPARADRPGDPRLPGLADRGQRRARPPRRRARRSCPRSSTPGAGPRSSASTRWKTAASSGPSGTTRG